MAAKAVLERDRPLGRGLCLGRWSRKETREERGVGKKVEAAPRTREADREVPECPCCRTPAEVRTDWCHDSSAVGRTAGLRPDHFSNPGKVESGLWKITEWMRK